VRAKDARSIRGSIVGWLGRSWVLLPLVVLYVWSFPYFERLNNPNELVRVYMTMSIVDDATYDITGVCRRHGWVNDRSAVGDRAYSSKAPGASFAGVPLYAAGRLAAGLAGGTLELRDTVRLLRLGVCVLPALLFLFFFRRHLHALGVSRFAADAVFLACAVASPFYTYIHQFAGHTPSACALFGAYMVLAGGSRSRRWSPARGAAFGFLLGSAPVLEYQALVPAVAVGVAFLAHPQGRRPLSLAAALAAAAVPGGLLVHFHASAFGSPFSTGYAYIENPAFQQMLSEGWMGTTYPRLDRLIFLLASRDTGLFVYSPLLAAAPLVAFLLPVVRRSPWWDRRSLRECLVCAAVSVTLLLFISANILWRAGWTAGPRYLTAMVPFMAVLSAYGLDAAHRTWHLPVRALALAAVMVGMVMSGVSGAIYPHLPVTFHNPVFEILVPLLRDGFVPHNLGFALGLPGLSSTLPALVLGVAPLLVHLVCNAHPRPTPRLLVLAAAMVSCALALAPLHLIHRTDTMPAWGLVDLRSVTTSWEPLHQVGYFPRKGCTVGGNVWSLRCADPITQGRVEARLGLDRLAGIRYRAYLRARYGPSRP
jgi:hypothetical protein